MSAERILVIDDEPSVIELCQRALGKEGFEVKGTLSGEEGLRLLKGRSFGLTLLDIKLPGLDGLDVLSTIQEMEPEMAVVIITSHGTMEVAIRALKLGAQDFMLKPFTPEELVTSVQKVLEKKRLTQENLRLKAHLPILEISKALMSEVNLEHLAQLALETVRHTLGAGRVSLMLLDEEQQELSISAALGLHDEVVATTQVKVGQGLAGLAAQRKKPILLPEQAKDDLAIQALLTRSDIGPAICLPLMLKDRVLGVLNVSRSLSGAPFYQDDVDLLSILGGQITVAIENARLFEQAQEEIAERKRAEEEIKWRNEELAALNAIAAAVSQSLDLKEVLEAALEETLEVLRVEGGLICLFDKTSQTFAPAVHRGISQDVLREVTRFKMGEGLSGRVAESGEALVVTDLSADPRNISPTASRQGWHSYAGVPIKSRDEVLGVMALVTYQEGHFSPDHVSLLSHIGNQIGVVIENVRLAEEASEIEILRELNRLRSELIANVSHELRTPLGLIKIFSTTLLREDAEFDRETQRELLRDIEEEADKLEKIVDNLLDLSQMKDGRLRLDRHPTDVGQLAREVIEAMKLEMRVQLTQHHFVHDFPSEPLMAAVDPKRIEQALRNLLSNAIKYSPAGGTITVQGRRDERQFLVRVSDQGIGIPSRDLERVFERFYRVENDITQAVRGAGLGLAVCRGIVEAHGGRIWVESTLGVGSTFYFTLPVLSKVEGPAGAGSESH